MRDTTQNPSWREKEIKMATALPRVTLLYNTEMRSFPSSIMGVNYQISTWMPLNYPDSHRKYPVIYLLDGEAFFGLVSGIVSGLVYAQVIPECLVVGVGHEVNSSDEWWQARAVDMNPPENPNVPSPEWMKPFKVRRAPDFLRFFKNELIPFIESTYQTDPADRCLAGYSWGGQFTINSLFHEPELFQKYFIGSGIWEYNLHDHLAYDEQFARQRKSLPVLAFFSVGSLEDDQVPYFHQFMEVLKRRNYKDFCLEARVLEGENHSSGCAVAYIQGLRALYTSNKKQA
jgi:predicted alpha/beta superfamily hydrolase